MKIKFKRGLRFQIFWKSAMSMLVFFVVIMIVTTRLLAGIVEKEDVDTAQTSVSNLQTQLSGKAFTYNNGDIKSNSGAYLYTVFEDYIRQCVSEGIYASAAVLDSQYNIIAETGNTLNVSLNNPSDRKIVLLDNNFTKEQIISLRSRLLKKGNQMGYVSGILNGDVIIPQSITFVGEDGKTEYNIKSNTAEEGPDTAVTTPVQTLSGSGCFEMAGPSFDMNSNTQKIYDECHSSVLNLLYKLKRSGPKTGGDNKSSIEYGYSEGQFEIKPGDYTYYVVYSSRYYPLDYAADLLRPVYIAGAIAALILLLILSSALSKGIAKPILQLKDYAVRMADGEKFVSYTLDSNRRDEITSLSESLAQMSENLSSAMTKLEDDIEREKKMEVMRRELTGGIAHELKTPLGIIHSYAEGLKEKIAEDKRDHYLDVIMDETERMDNLVLDMLDLSKLESNAYQINPEMMDLSAMTARVLRRFEKSINDKGIILEFSSTENMFINADLHRMEQVITNFVTNAIRHTPPGKKISVSISSDEKNVLFEIANEGEHIPADQLKKIWDTFYKVDKSRDRSKGGTGLGLAIAGSILNLHHAGYGAQNTQNGVKFWFEIWKRIC